MTDNVTGSLRFHEKVAIVTGGCQGIGKGCVDVLGMLLQFFFYIIIFKFLFEIRVIINDIHISYTSC